MNLAHVILYKNKTCIKKQKFNGEMETIMEKKRGIFLNEDGCLRTTPQILIVAFTFLLISMVGQSLVTTVLFGLTNAGVLPAGITESYFWSGLIPETVLNFLAGGMILVWYKVLNKKKIETMGVPSILKNLKYVGLGMLVIILALAGVTAILLLVGDVKFTGLEFPASIWQYFLLMSSVSFVEEVLNRGYIQHLVRSRSSLFWSCVIPSFVFMLFHLKNPGVPIIGFVNIFLAGMFFSILTYKVGNIWFGFGAHMIWNAGAACIFGLMSVSSVTGSILNFEYTRSTFFNGQAATPLNGLIATIMWLILIVIFGCIFPRKRAYL